MDKCLYAMRAFARRTDLELDLIRAYLGIALFVRGVLFVSHPDLVLQYLGQDGRWGWFWPAAIAHYIGVAHVAGGIMLAIGLTTRLAAVVQLPVLLGAVSCTRLREGIFWAGQSMEFSALILFLLVIFIIFGSGPWSADSMLTEPRAETIQSPRAIAEVTTL